MKQSTMGFTTTLIAAALLLGSASAQQFLGQCPAYQSTVAFDQAFVDKMTALNSGGYIVRFSNGATEPCQRLQFIDGNDHNVTFIDPGNFQRNYTNRYSYALATPSSPAYLLLQMNPRLLGADMGGNLKLYPLIARDDLLVFISCIGSNILNFFMTEQVLVMTPYAAQGALADADILTILEEFKIPKQEELKNISQECDPQAPTADSPLSEDVYNLVSNIVNPFGGVSDIALRYGAPNQDPAEASEQLMRMFREAGISPAQFYAQTGGTIIQNMPTNAAQLSYNSFQKVAGSGRSPQHSYDPTLQATAMAINSHQYQNYNPAFPLQHLYQQSIPMQPYPSNSIYSHGVPSTSFANPAANQYSVNSPSVTAFSGVNQPSSSLHHHQQTGSTSTQHKPSATVYNAIRSQPSSVSGVSYNSVQSALPSSAVQTAPVAAAGSQNIYYHI